MSADNILDYFQDDVVGRLAGDPFFNDIQLIEERLGVTSDDVAKGLNAVIATGGKKPGLVVIVRMPSREPLPQQAGPQYILRCELLVIELPKIRAGAAGNTKSSRLVSTKLDALFHQWTISGSSIEVEAALPYNDDEGGIGFSHVLAWRAGQPRPLQATAPRITTAGTTVIITNNEPGASVYYSEDGTLPYAGHGTAYTTPFPSSTGKQIRAAAYISGKQGSDVPTLKVP